MKILSNRYFKKAYGGAVMFQVLLGLGLMVMMSPMIFRQIKKYNEEIAREEVVHDLEKWQKAAASFVVFEKDTMNPSGNPDKIPYGTVVKTGDDLKTLLSDYLSGNPPTKNNYDQTYGMITVRNEYNPDQVESVVFAYGGGKEMNRLRLNGIGQFLFDKGAVMDGDGKVWSNLNVNEQGVELSESEKGVRISPTMTNILKTYKGKTETNQADGLLFMYVSDAYFVSDYLFSTPMPGVSADASDSRASFVNTMIVDLDMNGNDMTNVENFYAQKLNGKSIYASQLSVSELVFGGTSTIEKDFEYQNNEGIVCADNKLPVTTGDAPNGPPDESKNLVEVDDLKVNNAKFKRLFIKDADVHGQINDGPAPDDPAQLIPEVEGKKYYVRGDVNITGTGTTVADDVYTNTLISEGKADENLTNITLLAPTANQDSYIYVANNVPDEDDSVSDPIIINFNGFSEADDICRGSAGTDCLSSKIERVYKKLQCWMAKYLNNKGESVDMTVC